MRRTGSSKIISALLGASAVIAGLALLPAGRGDASTAGPAASPTATARATPSKTSSPRPSKKPKPRHKHKHTGTTVNGKRLYDPATFGLLKDHSSVTVSQTANLTNQFVQVTWRNFTPSIPQIQQPDIYVSTGLQYPVEVAECNTIHVKYWNQCYGAATGGGLGQIGPDGPDNTAYATTLPNGSGSVEIQILVAEQNQFLGCGFYHRCSLVIVPAQGGYTDGCDDHSLDSQLTAFASSDFGGTEAPCSWKDRIVVPLRFVRTPKFCPIKNASFTALGSPMLNLAMQQWAGQLCVGSNPITISYNPSITEPSAVQDLGLGFGDVALTTRPGPTQIGKRKYTFAPLAVSAVSVAYWVDNPKNLQPFTGLKLDPGLVAKLLTQSYAFENDGCQVGQPPQSTGCDSAVDGNPISIFADPEYKKLNPGMQPQLNVQDGIQVPNVMSGHSDMTWEITRWIAANPDASAFMRGQFDRWGAHVNTNYLAVHYPTDGFTGQDNFPFIQHLYSPTFPLSAVVQLQAANTDDGSQLPVDPTTGNYTKDSPQVPGDRGLFAVLDEGDAAAQGFPTAELLNAAGRYVAPTPKSMAAALATMKPIGDNGIVQQVNFSKKKFGAYPLTMVIYAMVPTSGISKTKAAAIATFLDYVAGPGQQRGLNVGQLPPGYLPLPAKLDAETLHAADLVRTQAGNPKPPKQTSSPSSSASPSGSKSPSASPSPSPTPTPGVRIVTIALKSAPSAGVLRYALPTLLIVGGLAGLGGASLFASAAGTAILVPLRRIRRPRLALRQLLQALRRKS